MSSPFVRHATILIAAAFGFNPASRALAASRGDQFDSKKQSASRGCRPTSAETTRNMEIPDEVPLHRHAERDG
jgi:hypothetical protein